MTSASSSSTLKGLGLRPIPAVHVNMRNLWLLFYVVRLLTNSYNTFLLLILLIFWRRKSRLGQKDIWILKGLLRNRTGDIPSLRRIKLNVLTTCSLNDEIPYILSHTNTHRDRYKCTQETIQMLSTDPSRTNLVYVIPAIQQPVVYTFPKMSCWSTSFKFFVVKFIRCFGHL